MKIEEKYFPNDLTVVYVEAQSFPDDIACAFDALKSKLEGVKRISYFGISNPEPGRGIVYRAAAATFPAVDAKELGLEEMIVPGGYYYFIQLSGIDFAKNAQKISETFERLLSQPDIDLNGYCIEIYDALKPDELGCIVRKTD